MQQESRLRPNVTSSTLVVAASVIAAAIFVLDTITDLEVAVEVLYVAVVLIAVRIFHQRTVLLVSLGCIGLTILSAYLSLSNPLSGAGIINDLISIAVIIAATYLGLKNQSAGIALQGARAELAHVNRVVTLGALTAAIAHEVNQPIGGAVTNAEAALRWLAAQPPELEEVRQALDAVVEDGKRASEIVMRIRALLAKAPSLRERLDINEVLLDVAGLLRSEIQKHRILLQTLLASDLPPVLGDRIQLQQVMLNLTLNAIEAMSGDSHRPRVLLISSAKQNQAAILVTVRDSGTGLDPESLDRVFDAFYTTKPGGIGMGLSICRSIVEAHSGRIWASGAERGASFHFTLPGIPK